MHQHHYSPVIVFWCLLFAGTTSHALGSAGSISKTLIEQQQQQLPQPHSSSAAGSPSLWAPAAANDEIKQLPGLEEQINFKHYSGYLTADLISTKANSSFVHYWLVESQTTTSTAPQNTDPLIVWFNGGPGCSSLLGLFNELGPFELIQMVGASNPATSSGQAARRLQVKLRANSWNKFANVLFLDSPIYAGYSYTNSGDSPLRQSDDSTVSLNLQALNSFYAKFPQLKRNPVYLIGQGYAAVYVATLAKQLLQLNKQPTVGGGINLKGVAFANGYLDKARSHQSLVLLAHHYGLYGKRDLDTYSRACCNSSGPSRGSCRYDEAWTECGNQTRRLIGSIINSGVNPYNILHDCHTQKAAADDDELQFLQLRPNEMGRKCLDDSSLTNYLNRLDVREALHVPVATGRGANQWRPCVPLELYEMKYPIQSGGLLELVNSLIDQSEHKLNLLIYSGDTDLVHNFLGTEWFADDLNRRVLRESIPWHVNKQVAGMVKHYEGISFVTVRGAGHMSAQDKPVETAALIEKFLYPHGRLQHAGAPTT